MAFNKKTWTDRVAEFINRRSITHEDGSEELVTVARSEGTVSQEGDAFNAATMNDLEERIEDEFETINSKLENSKKLLWSNPNPTDVFAAQTITLNETLANYDFVEVLYKPYNNVVSVLSSGQVLPTIKTYVSFASNLNMLRTFIFNNTNKVAISNGSYYDGFNGPEKTNNVYMIPFAIYGYKYF